MNKLAYKTYLLFIFIFSFIGSSGSFFAQYILHLNPCPLCIFQRVAIISICAVSLILLTFKYRFDLSKFLASFLLSIPAVIGFLVAARQIYLQQLPPSEVPACGPGLDFLMQTLPFSNVISTVLNGSGECAEVQKVLFIPLPIWSIALFSFFLIIAWLGFFKTKK